MRKRVMILIVCLALCAMFLQALPYGVEATANPTAAGLAEFAIKAYQDGWGYVYGTYGQTITQTIIDGKARQYPGNFNSILSDGRTIYQTAQKWIGHRAADCVGLMKAYVWWQGDDLGPGYNSYHDRSADGTFAAASIKGPLSTIPETHGVCLWREGHVGVYIGNGWVIEARGTAYGVVMTRLSDRGWTNWFYYPYVSYSANGWTTIAGQTFYYLNGCYVTGIQNIDGKIYNFGGDGVLSEGMTLIDGKLRYFRADGLLLSGWQTLNGEKYYFDADGFASTGWTEIGDQNYLFGSDGILLQGWQAADGEIYYLDGDGMARTGQQLINEKTYWFDEAGRLLTGWQTIADGPAFRDLSSQIITGLQMIDGQSWLFDESGRLLTGWQTVGEDLYYFDPVTGAALTAGLHQIDDETRLFNLDGSLNQSAGLYFADGQIYLSDSTGRPLTGTAVLSGTSSSAETTETKDFNVVLDENGVLQLDSGAGFTLAATSLVLTLGSASGQGLLTAAGLMPDDGQPVSWLSLDPDIVTVDSCGQLTAAGTGRTLVFLVTSDGEYAAALITVLPDPQSHAIETDTLTLEPGRSARLSVDGQMVEQTGATEIQSSNSEIIKIDEAGIITAIAAGQAVIRANYNGQTVDLLTVTVEKPLLGLAVSRTSLLLPVGAKATAFADHIYSDCNVDLTFISSNPTIASVSPDGIIRGLTHGSAIITATAGEYFASCTVTVNGTYPILRRGSTGEQVRDLQQRLSDLGYITGPVDGSFGPLTEFGVLCAQKNLGMNLTGTADHQLRIALQADTVPRAASVQSAGSLQPGDSGETVFVLQKRLADLGYFKGDVTGTFDDLTGQAIQTMRVINSLPAANHADTELISRLLGQKIIAGSAKLESGQTGYEVQLLQTRLQALNYYSGPLDGIYSDAVIYAVKAFQFQADLGIDGVAGPSTQKAIYAAGAPACTADALKAVTLTTLGSGMSGDAVRILEDRLVSLGYHLGVADHIYDSLTANSISDFQKRCGFTQTGVADVNTQLRLFDEAAKTSLSIYQYGSRGTSVQKIQTRINQLGFNCGSVDGSFGPKTQNSIRDFQTQAGLPADGIAAWTTLARLFAEDAPKAPVSVTVPVTSSTESVINVEARLVALGYLFTVPDDTFDSMTASAVKAFQRSCYLSQTGLADSTTQNRLFAATAPASTAVYRYGSRGTTVKYIQARLNQLGFSCGSVDGSFGSKTRAAVVAYQKSAGLKADGIVAWTTRARLFANGTQPPAAVTVVQTTTVYRYGSRGSGVSKIQTRLNQLGFNCGPVDGRFGPKTQAAVLAFQRKAGLKADGIVDKATSDILFSSSAPRAG